MHIAKKEIVKNQMILHGLFWLLLEVSGGLAAIWLRSARREAPIDNIVKICSPGAC